MPINPKLLSVKRQRIIPAAHNLAHPPNAHPTPPRILGGASGLQRKPPGSTPVSHKVIVPGAGKPLQPHPTPILNPGWFGVNEHNNVIRVTAPGNYFNLFHNTPAPTLRSSYAHPAYYPHPFGNGTAKYNSTAQQGMQISPTIKSRSGSSARLSPTQFPGNQSRRGPNAVNPVTPINRKIQNGGQAYLPGYMRQKLYRPYGKK